MENITLGQVAGTVTFLGAFIGGVILLFNYVKKWLKLSLKDEFENMNSQITLLKTDINNQIKSLKADLSKEAIANCKNFLVECQAKAESGLLIDEAEKERYYEEFDVYTNEYHQNSYIHAKHEKLKKEGKI